MLQEQFDQCVLMLSNSNPRAGPEPHGEFECTHRAEAVRNDCIDWDLSGLNFVFRYVYKEIPQNTVTGRETQCLF